MGFVAGTTVLPVQGATLESRQGQRPSAWHNGIDLSVATGTPVVAIAAGTVERIKNDCPQERGRRSCVCTEKSGYGNYVLIKHAEGFYSFYAHLDTVAVAGGTPVVAGTPIGTVGSNIYNPPDVPADKCMSMAPHLHLEIVKGWPLGGRTNRYDVLRELAAGGIVVQAGGLAVTGVATDYNESRLQVTKAYGLREDPTAGAPSKTTGAGKSVKWPLYVGIGAVVVTTLLIVWRVARRRR